MTMPYTPTNRLLSPPLKLIPPGASEALYDSNLTHFHSIPWTSALLKAPDTIPLIPQCRIPGSDCQDQLFGATLAADRAIPYMLCCFTCEGGLADDGDLWDKSKPVTKVHTLFQLGTGLAGNPGILHGGAAMAMIDEAMGVVPEINTALGKEGVTFQSTNVTAGVEIKFLKPIPLGNAVVATSWIESIERRKTRIRCEIRDKDGVAMASCISTWIAIKPNI